MLGTELHLVDDWETRSSKYVRPGNQHYIGASLKKVCLMTSWGWTEDEQGQRCALWWPLKVFVTEQHSPNEHLGLSAPLVHLCEYFDDFAF